MFNSPNHFGGLIHPILYLYPNLTMMALPLNAIEPAAASNKPVVNRDACFGVKNQPPDHRVLDLKRPRTLPPLDCPCAK